MAEITPNVREISESDITPSNVREISESEIVTRDRSTSPLSASERAALSIKQTPMGKANYLTSLYGEGNVHRMGEDFFVSPDGNPSQW